MEYVTLTATYPEGYYENPNFSISGRIPIETDFSDGITYNGYEFKFEKSMETVTTGSNTLTLTITAKEWDESKTESVTVTITGVQGEGYPIEDE